MKNSEKFVTAQERSEAFLDWCVAKTDFSKCSKCVIVDGCDCCPARGVAYWLDLEAEEEKPLPCPFCGAECKTLELFLEKDHYVVCDKCRYASSRASTEHEAIAAHNRVAKAVRESEAKA